MNALRQIPTDFAAKCAIMLKWQLEDHYKASPEVVQRWRNECGIDYCAAAIPTKPIPTDFVEIAHGKNVGEIMKHYQSSNRVVRRWLAEAGVELTKQKPRYTRELRAMPADFRDVFSDMSIPALKKRYSASGKVVSRWIAETGQVRRIGNPNHHKKAATKHVVKRAPKGKVTYLAEAKVASPRHVNVSRKPGNPGMVNRVERDMTSVGQAADFLRKYSGVWRCTPTGSPDPKGTHWRRGSSILTDAEIIERAEYNGWDADAWKRVA